MPQTGFATIGQSPRDDVLRSMFPHASPGEILQAGALDDTSETDLDHLAPGPTDTPFVTRMRDGREVLVNEQSLKPYLQQAVDRISDLGAGTIVVLCTGAFPDLRAGVPLVFPDTILRANVNALVPRGTLGVVMPNAGQRGMMQEKWAHPDRRLITVSVSPYTAAATPDQTAIDALADCDLIVLDCMGFSEDMRSAWQQNLGGPVILANRLVGRVLEEIDPDLRA